MMRMTNRLRIVGLMLALMAGFATATMPAGAQDDPPTSPLLVMVVTCADATCTDVDTAPRVPDITVSAWDSADDTFLASCPTDSSSQSGGCTLEIPDGVDYYLTWEPATLDGYTYLGELIPVNDPQGPSGWIIPFVPDAVETVDILVNALLCDDAACTDAAGAWIPDFEISAVEDGTDTLLDSCLTDPGSQFGGCALTVPGNVPDFYFDWDPAQVPDGYEFYDILVSDGEMGPVVHTLAFVPTGSAPTETPATTTPAPTATATSTAISGLPATGATGSSQTGSTGMLLLASGLLLGGALVLGASRLRTR